MYYEVSIRKHHAGFGMWEAGEAHGEGWEDEQNLVAAIAQHVAEMCELGGPDPLPSEVEDIRGRISHEPLRVFAIRHYGHEDIAYLGIVEREPPQGAPDASDTQRCACVESPAR